MEEYSDKKYYGSYLDWDLVLISYLDNDYYQLINVECEEDSY